MDRAQLSVCLCLSVGVDFHHEAVSCHQVKDACYHEGVQRDGEEGTL